MVGCNPLPAKRRSLHFSDDRSRRSALARGSIQASGSGDCNRGLHSSVGHLYPQINLLHQIEITYRMEYTCTGDAMRRLHGDPQPPPLVFMEVSSPWLKVPPPLLQHSAQLRRAATIFDT